MKRKPKVRWWVALDNWPDAMPDLYVGGRPHRFSKVWFAGTSDGSRRMGRLYDNHLSLKPGQCVEIEPPTFRRKRTK